MLAFRTRTPTAPTPVPPRSRVPAVLLGAVSLAAVGATGARSSEGSGSDGADDERGSGDPRGLATGNKKLRLTISGQIGRGVLLYDDGTDTGAIHVDNDNSSTRLRFVAEPVADSPLTLGARIEVELQSNPSNVVSQTDQENVGGGSFEEREVELYAKSDAYGELFVGQGSTASDNTAEIDLSGTSLAGYSDVDDTGGGLRFRSGATLTDVDVASVFGNLDGLGRDDRLRYDTPTIRDVTASVSFASDEARDVALRWERNRDAGAWHAAAAIAYADTGNGSGDADGDAGDGGAEKVESRLSASASLRLVGGWNLTVAGARADADDRTPTSGYVKLGYRFAPFSLGETRVSADWQVSSRIARPGERATSVGLGLVQEIARFDASLFAMLRRYELHPADGAFEVDGDFPAGLDATSDAAAIDVAMFGLRVPF